MKLSLVVLAVFVALVAAQAPLYGVGSETAIDSEYIVVLNEKLTAEMRDRHLLELTNALPTVEVLRKYAIGTFVGFSVRMDKNALARELEHADVKFIEANQVVRVSEDYKTQIGADWGLTRTTQTELSLDGTFYYYVSSGKGVNAYVVDTGILTSHEEFGGRAFPGANFVNGETADDCNGHGTHVAGTIGGSNYGMAKEATLIGVKVLGCTGSGTYDGVIAGIQWVATNHTNSKSKRSVANMSLGGGVSSAVDNAVAAASNQGVPFVVAAGNSNTNACNSSPARAPEAITVGATANNDARASYSNYGKCLDIYAPGTNIKSSWIGSNTATSTISGTSMASPHVAGAVALWLGHLDDADVPASDDVAAAATAFLTKVATSDKVTNPGALSPNLLLYSPYN